MDFLYKILFINLCPHAKECGSGDGGAAHHAARSQRLNCNRTLAAAIEDGGRCILYTGPVAHVWVSAQEFVRQSDSSLFKIENDLDLRTGL